MRKIILGHLNVLNLPREICEVLLGKDHKTSHRMMVGLGVMGAGVGIAHCTAGVTPVVFSYLGDMFGYLIHALGAVPFLERLLESVE